MAGSISPSTANITPLATQSLSFSSMSPLFARIVIGAGTLSGFSSSGATYNAPGSNTVATIEAGEAFWSSCNNGIGVVSEPDVTRTGSPNSDGSCNSNAKINGVGGGFEFTVPSDFNGADRLGISQEATGDGFYVNASGHVINTFNSVDVNCGVAAGDKFKFEAIASNQFACYKNGTLVASFTSTWGLGTFKWFARITVDHSVSSKTRSAPRVYGDISNWNFANSVITVATDGIPPSDVANLTATKFSNSRVDIDSGVATDNIAVTGYKTQRRIDGGSWLDLTPTSKAFSDTENFPTTPNTYSFEYRRKAKDAAGNESVNWSNIPAAVSITIPVTPPVANFTITPATVVQGGTVVLTDTSTNSPTARQWKLDGANISTFNPYNLDTAELEIGVHTIRLDVSNAGGSDFKQLTFEVTESFIDEHFERLQLCKIFNISSLDLEIPLLSADFGDGYGAGALSGLPAGLRGWSITADVLPDLDSYSVDFSVDNDNLTATRFQYFWDFFKRHIALGNKPFYFTDPRTGRKFLASFVEPRLSFEVFTSKLYGGGVQLKQRRVKLEGLTFRAEDGSINE